MSVELFRLECLRLAATVPGILSNEIPDVAEVFFEFIFNNPDEVDE